MSFWVVKKCCFCVDLRLGSFLIAYLMLISRVGVLILTSIRIAKENNMLQHGVHSIVVQDIAFMRLVSIISLMILIFEFLLTVALLVGLAKRLDQHLEMYYVGSFAFLVMGTLIYAALLLRYAELFGTWAWLLVATEICMKMIMLYFLAVIRSYYYKMREDITEDERRLDGKDKKSYFSSAKPALSINSKP